MKFFFLIFLLIPTLSARGDSSSFSIPRGLEDEVRFWKAVFGAYGGDQVIIHDEKFLNVIYEVVDFSSLGKRKDLSHEAKREIRRAQIGRRVKKIADQVDREAANRIRVQIGQKEKLKEAIERSSPTMGDIQGVFESRGLPKELTALVFIESMFNPKALSEAGALGLWQFMPDTGREYVSMNAFWDNRGDPLHSTIGAAEFLADLYKKMGDWGIAINAYHSGPGRLLRAKEILKTGDIAEIIHHYDDPAYGFYSRNYFPEFLAVVDLYKNRNGYFGPDEGAGPAMPQYDIVKTGDFVNLPEIMVRFAIEESSLKRLNPSLTEAVLEGELPLPPYYPLKVPRGLGYYLAGSVGLTGGH